MKAIHNTPRSKSFSTNEMSYPTNDLQNNKTLRKQYIKDDQSKGYLLNPRTPFPVSNGLSYYSNQLHVSKGRSDIRFYVHCINLPKVDLWKSGNSFWK